MVAEMGLARAEKTGRGEEGQLHCIPRAPGEVAAQDGQKIWLSLLSSGGGECSRQGLKGDLETNHTRRVMSPYPWPAAMGTRKQTHGPVQPGL